ncbi:hypothetical protein LTR85_001552 [Meristemomyces frigidus]|nr:hypothetical protein LTR85_001552 [Meristemomyces frigidus]
MDELSSWDCSELPEAYLKNLLRTDNLPRDLDDFYDLIIRRVQPLETRVDMFVILKWVLVSARPMTVDELVDACATLPLEGMRFDEGKRRACQGFAKRLEGLVKVRTMSDGHVVSLDAAPVQASQTSVEGDVVSFAHFSVKEYLLRMTPLGWFRTVFD